MERLIDDDRLKEVFSRNVAGGNAYFDLIDMQPTVETIPKTEYEARLKADMVAMLTEIQTEIEELQGKYSPYYDEASQNISELIQQKIDKQKGEWNDN